MQYRKDKQGNDLSVLGFGCMRFPSTLGIIDIEKTQALVAEAIERGVNYFDTAYIYPGSEDALGKVLRNLNARGKVSIATKLPHARCHSLADVQKMFDTSLQRLQTDHVEYYLIHNVTRAEQWDALVSLGIEDWIAQQKSSGTIRNIGFSFHGTISEFKKILPAYDWDFCQIQYNYLNEHYQAGVEGLKMAADRGIPVIIMEPLLGGKLSTNLPKDAARAFADVDPESSPAQWGLRWLFNQPEVTVVLSGMNAPEQLEQNLQAAETEPGSLTEPQLEAIAKAQDAFAKESRINCTGCNYCQPCPKGINIPSCFAAYNESYSMGWFTGAWHYAISVGASSGNLHFASDCINCGACERKCPQGLSIREDLKSVCRRLEVPGERTILKAYAKLI